MLEETKELLVLEEVRFEVSIEDIDKSIEEYKDIIDIDPESKEAKEIYKKAKVGKSLFVKYRIGIEATRKRIKAPALAYSKRVDALAKEITAKGKETEYRLSNIVKKADDYKQAKKREAELKELKRVEAIQAKIEALRELPLVTMGNTSDRLTEVYNSIIHPTVEEYEERYEDAIIVWKNTLEKLDKAIETTIKAETAEKVEAELRKEAKRKEDEALEIKRTGDKRLRDKELELERREAEIRRKEDEERNRLSKEYYLKEKEKQINNTIEQIKKETSITDEDAKALINNIMDNNIPNIRWEGN